MQVGPRAQPGTSCGTDQLPAPDRLSRMDEDLGAVAIQRGHPPGVHQYYTASVAPPPRAPDNFSVRGGADGRPKRSGKIDASVHAGITEDRVHPHSEAGSR